MRRRISEAVSGLEAIEQLPMGPVALMVLDLNMPDSARKKAALAALDSAIAEGRLPDVH